MKKRSPPPERALLLAPEDSRIHYLLYAIYLEMEQFELAQFALGRTLEITTPNVQLYHDLATVHIKQGQLAEAIKALECALACTVQVVEQAILWHQISVLQLKSENFAEALMACQSALNLVPDDVNLIYTQIAVHQQMMDYEAAIKLLESNLLPIVGSDDQRALHLQGTLYLLHEQPLKAVEIFSNLAKADDQNANWHYHLAQAYQQGWTKGASKQSD